MILFGVCYVRVVFVHQHSFPFFIATTMGIVEKIKEIGRNATKKGE